MADQPPPRANPDYGAFYERLRRNPGQWYPHPGSASAARKYAMRHDGFDYVMRGTPPNQTTWMVWNPDD